jgi:PhnB protein
MVGKWKPEGYNDASVYIVTNGAQKVIEFLKKVFGVEELRRFDGPDGKIMHAEVRVGDTVVMIADAGGAYPAFPAWLHVYVADADAVYRRALGAGGVSLQEPVRKNHDPDKRGGFKDPGGNTWWVSTQMEAQK